MSSCSVVSDKRSSVMYSFGCFPGVWLLYADVSEPSIGSILHPALEDGTDRGFRNVGIQQSDAGETPKRIHNRFKTRRKFEIKEEIISLHDIKALTYFSQQMSSKLNHIQPDTMWGNNEIQLCFCATRVAGEKGTFYSTLNLKILFRQWTFSVPIKRYCVTPNFSLFSCRPLWTWCGPSGGGHAAHVEKPWSRRLFYRLPQQGSFIAYKACNSLTILWQLLCIEIW